MFTALFSIIERCVHYSSSPYFSFSFDPKCIIQIYSFLLFLQNIIINVITRNDQVTKIHFFLCIHILYCKLCHFYLHRFRSSQFSVFSKINSHIIKNSIIFLAFCNLNGTFISNLLFPSSVSITLLYSSYVSASSAAS